MTTDLSKLAKYFSDEDAARELLESWRWPNGAACPWDTVRDIRTRHVAGGVSQRALAREYSVQPRTINLIVHGKTWALEQAG